MFFLSSFVLLIMFMNMIIQVMGLPFDTVQENKTKYINQFKIGLMIDFKRQVNLKDKFHNYKYIMIAYPEESAIQDSLGDHLTLFDVNQQLHTIKKDIGA